ncbi:Tubulin alpha chain [Psidium guajava]|nr:Tubulin alpha chain [Psidium guajava]
MSINYIALCFLFALERRCLPPLLSWPLPTHPPPLPAAAVEGHMAEMGEARKKWVFFAVVNHMVAVEKRESIEQEAREFFGQGSEVKKKVRRDEKWTLGYQEKKHTKNVTDWRRC